MRKIIFVFSLIIIFFGSVNSYSAYPEDDSWCESTSPSDGSYWYVFSGRTVTLDSESLFNDYSIKYYCINDDDPDWWYRWDTTNGFNFSEYNGISFWMKSDLDNCTASNGWIKDSNNLYSTFTLEPKVIGERWSYFNIQFEDCSEHESFDYGHVEEMRVSTLYSSDDSIDSNLWIDGFHVYMNSSKQAEYSKYIDCGTNYFYNDYFRSDLDYSSDNITKGLVGHWTFDGYLGEFINKNDGIDYGDSSFNKGKIATGLNLDGNDDYIKIPDDDVLDLGNQYSISFWLKALESDLYAPTIINRHGQSGGDGYWFIYFSGDSLSFQWATGSNYHTQYFSGAITWGEWNLVTFTLNSENYLDLYVNGNKFSTSRYLENYLPVTSGDLFVGSYQGWSNCMYNGSIDDLRLYNNVLSQSEITSLYNFRTKNITSTFSFIDNTISIQRINGTIYQLNQLDSLDNINKTITDGLVGYWKLDGNSDDSSIYTNDGTNYGATFGSEYGVYNQGADFDGSNDYIDCGSDSILNINNKITLSAWVKFSYNPSVYSRPIAGKTQYGISNGYILGMGYNRAQFDVGNGTNWHAYNARGTSNIGDTNWHHIVGVDNGTSIKIYVDSFLENEKFIGSHSILTSSTNFKIAYNTFNGGLGEFYYFDGSIDDVRLYDRALSSDEIKALYLANSGSFVVNGTWNITCEKRVLAKFIYINQSEDEKYLSQGQNIVSIDGEISGFYLESLPNLKPINITFSNNNPKKGDTITIGVYYSNFESVNTTTLFHLNLFRNITNMSSKLESKNLSFGEVKYKEWIWNIENEGDYKFIFSVDNSSLIEESVESDNIISKDLHVGAPDLTIQSIEFNDTNTNGDVPIKISIVVKNIGDYICSNNTNVTLYMNNSYFLANLSVGEIEPGGYKIIEYNWSSISGYHNFTAEVDLSNLNNESDEDNNIFSTDFPPTPPELYCIWETGSIYSDCRELPEIIFSEVSLDTKYSKTIIFAENTTNSSLRLSTEVNLPNWLSINGTSSSILIKNGSYVALNITINCTSNLVYSKELSFSSSDLDESSFSIKITAYAQPEISVLWFDDTLYEDSNDLPLINFSFIKPNDPQTRVIYFENLYPYTAQLSLNSDKDYISLSWHANTLYENKKSLIITFTPQNLGYYYDNITFTTNDPDEETFMLSLYAEVSTLDFLFSKEKFYFGENLSLGIDARYLDNGTIGDLSVDIEIYNSDDVLINSSVISKLNEINFDFYIEYLYSWRALKIYATSEIYDGYCEVDIFTNPPRIDIISIVDNVTVGENAKIKANITSDFNLDVNVTSYLTTYGFTIQESSGLYNIYFPTQNPGTFDCILWADDGISVSNYTDTITISNMLPSIDSIDYPDIVYFNETFTVKVGVSDSTLNISNVTVDGKLASLYSGDSKEGLYSIDLAKSEVGEFLLPILVYDTYGAYVSRNLSIECRRIDFGVNLDLKSEDGNLKVVINLDRNCTTSLNGKIYIKRDGSVIWSSNFEITNQSRIEIPTNISVLEGDYSIYSVSFSASHGNNLIGEASETYNSQSFVSDDNLPFDPMMYGLIATLLSYFVVGSVYSKKVQKKISKTTLSYLGPLSIFIFGLVVIKLGYSFDFINSMIFWTYFSGFFVGMISFIIYYSSVSRDKIEVLE